MIPRMGTLTGVHGMRLALTSIAATGLAVAAAIAVSSGASAADPLKIQVGAGQGQVSANAYLPGKVTIEAGSSITFTVGADEPHTVSFGVGPADVAPDAWPVSGWTAPTSTPPAPVQLGEATYDGSGFINTGIIYKGSTATVTFPTPGSYVFACAIHPGMAG